MKPLTVIHCVLDRKDCCVNTAYSSWLVLYSSLNCNRKRRRSPNCQKCVDDGVMRADLKQNGPRWGRDWNILWCGGPTPRGPGPSCDSQRCLWLKRWQGAQWEEAAAQPVILPDVDCFKKQKPRLATGFSYDSKGKDRRELRLTSPVSDSVAKCADAIITQKCTYSLLLGGI